MLPWPWNRTHANTRNIWIWLQFFSYTAVISGARAGGSGYNAAGGGATHYRRSGHTGYANVLRVLLRLMNVWLDLFSDYVFDC